MFNFLKQLPNCLPKWLYHFAFLSEVNESCCCYTSLPVFDVVQSDRCVVVSHCFNLHSLGDVCCGASFHMLICHLYIFFGEMSVKAFGPFFNMVVFLLLSFKSSLYILDNNPFSDVSFANIFFSSLWLVF